MYSNRNCNDAFHVHSAIEATVLKPLVNCQPDALFARESAIAPMGLNLFFGADTEEDYADLISREIGLYAERFQHHTLTKTWFRGSPLSVMKSGELTELAFHTNMSFSSEFSGAGEYGFECETADITETNMALMKGLRFNHILLAVDTMIPPEKQHISQRLELIDEYRFQNIHYRLDVRDTDPDTLSCWLDTLLAHQPHMLEIQGLAEMDVPVPLSSLAGQLANCDYQLLGDRFFVPSDHNLLSLKQQNNLQYTPWGLCQRQLTDWLGVGLGALGKLSRGYYQNTDAVERYRQSVLGNQLPVCCSGAYPDCQQKPYPWQLVDQLLCQHQVVRKRPGNSLTLSPSVLGVFEKAKSRGWLQESATHFKLTEMGLNHLAQLCRDLQDS